MGEDDLIVRPAMDGDLPAVLELYGQPGLDDGKTLSVDQAVELFRRFKNYPDYNLYVAERSGDVIGTFALLVMDNLGHLGAPSGIVEDVGVAPGQQSSGVGKAMMHFAIDRCRDRGCYKLMLSSNMKRERAHAFYERIGFVRHGYSFRVDLAEQAA